MDITTKSFIFVLTAGHILHGSTNWKPLSLATFNDRLSEWSILTTDIERPSSHTDHKMRRLCKIAQKFKFKGYLPVNSIF